MLAVACVYRSDDADSVIAMFATADDLRACERYSRPSRKRQSLTSRALLRALLEQAFGAPAQSWKISYDVNNKPIVTAVGCELVYVSVSHSRDLVACAVTDLGDIGIDVEYCTPRKRLRSIAEATFGEAEHAAVCRGGVQAFYKIWTLREALAKASGLGLLEADTRSDLFASAPTGRAWSAAVRRQHWIFYYRKLLPRYALSLALKHGRPRQSRLSR